MVNWKIIERTINGKPYRWELSGSRNHEIWRTDLSTGEAVKFWYVNRLGENEFLAEIDKDIKGNLTIDGEV